MQLTPDERSLFYKLLTPLQVFAGQQIGLWPASATADEVLGAPSPEFTKARDAVYEQPELIEAFCEANPAGLTATELDQVRQWRHFVRGDFHIERLLKKGAVFIEESKVERVFLVTALSAPWDEAVPTYALPLWVTTVLLPFQGHIVTDGVMAVFPVHFGGGITRNLKEIYLTAKQNDRLITTLPPPAPATVAPADRTAAWAADVDAIVAAVNKLQGGAAPVQAPALKVLQDAAKLASLAARQPDDVNELWDAVNDVYRGYSRVCTVRKRSRR